MDAGKGTVGIAAGGLLMLLALVTASVAQTYKWVDEKGTVHFSNDPPAKAPLEVVPESARRPAVRQPPPADEPDRDAVEIDEAAPRRGRAAPAAEDGASEEIFVEESETIIIDDGTRDPVTRYRANSPRNRPGQPIRQAPVRQPRRGR